MFHDKIGKNKRKLFTQYTLQVFTDNTHHTKFVSVTGHEVIATIYNSILFTAKFRERCMHNLSCPAKV